MGKPPAKLRDKALLGLMESLLVSNSGLSREVMEEPKGLQRLQVRLANAMLPHINRIESQLAEAEMKKLMSLASDLEDVLKIVGDAYHSLRFSAGAMRRQELELRKLRDELAELKSVKPKKKPH